MNFSYNSFDFYSRNKNKNFYLDKSMNLIINAHESAIAAIALNQEGTLLATASEKVFLI